MLMFIVSVIYSIPCTAQTSKEDSCICGETRIKAIEMLAVDARANKQAYDKEHILRLQDSSNYNYTISRLEKSRLEIEEAYKLEQATPKVIVKANPDWYWFAAGGSAVTVITYFIYKLFIKK